MDKWISKSKADVVLLGGDFNAGPVEEDGNLNIYLNNLTNLFHLTKLFR